MIIVNITYKCELKEIEMNLEEHRNFLDKYYKLNKFICSGRKNPRVGGIILCNTSKKECESIIEEDPFYNKNLASYELIEFEASKQNENFIKDIL